MSKIRQAGEKTSKKHPSLSSLSHNLITRCELKSTKLENLIQENITIQNLHTQHPSTIWLDFHGPIFPYIWYPHAYATL